MYFNFWNESVREDADEGDFITSNWANVIFISIQFLKLIFYNHYVSSRVRG